jgi:peptidoglycan/LPS O-acetylase OafA/YrhL
MRLPPDLREAELGYAAAALATAVIVAGLATRSVPRLTWFLELRPLTWTGRRSYGLYLWHFPLFLMLADRAYGPVPGSVVGISVTFAVATLSYRFVEQPFLRTRHPTTERASVPLTNPTASRHGSALVPAGPERTTGEDHPCT